MLKRKYKPPVTDPAEKAYEAVLKEKPFCFACGRGEKDRHQHFHAKWTLHRAHIAAGASKMIRVEDRRAIIVLCPICHLLHTTNGKGMSIIFGESVPQLGNANTLFLKRQLDSEWWDPDWITPRWVGIPPEPIPPPQWFLNQFRSRRPAEYALLQLTKEHRCATTS